MASEDEKTNPVKTSPMAFAQPIDWPYKTHAGSWQALAEELNAHAGFPRQRWWSEYAPLKQPVAGTREAVLAWWAGLEHLRTYYVAAGYDHDIFDSLGAALEAWIPGVKGTRYAPHNKHLKTVLGEFSFWAKGFRSLWTAWKSPSTPCGG